MEKQIAEILEVIQTILETAQSEFSEAAEKLSSEQSGTKVAQSLSALSQRWSGLDPTARARVIAKSQSESVKLEDIFRKLSNTLNELPYIREDPSELDAQIFSKEAELRKLEYDPYACLCRIPQSYRMSIFAVTY